MKKKIVTWLFLFCPLALLGQNVDSLVRAIRSEYNLIVKNKESYEKLILDIDHSEDPFYDEDGHLIGDEAYIEELITYYIDKKDQIKLISHYKAQIHHDYAIYGATLTEYYLKGGNLFFIYQQTKEVPFGQHFYIEDGLLTTATEKRIYTTATERRIYTTGDVGYTYLYDKRGVDGHVSVNNCVRYLLKSAEGNFSDVNELLQKTDNIEIDCSDTTEDVPHSVKSLIDLFYGWRAGIVDTFDEQRVGWVSEEELPRYFCGALFGQ